jgi:hypothetical protein
VEIASDKHNYDLEGTARNPNLPSLERKSAGAVSQRRREQLERISDASLNRIEALMVPPAH